MTQALQDFCSVVRLKQSHALEALLKIAETKDAMLHWKQEIVSVLEEREAKDDPRHVAIALALAQVDQAEETILDAFCLSRHTKVGNLRDGPRN